MTAIPTKAALPIHVLSWAIAIEKEKSVSCHFAECQFMALSLEDMGKHHALCTLSENAKYPFVCKTCNRCTDVMEKLLLHRLYSHSYEPTTEEKRTIDDYLDQPVKKVITPIIRKYWDLYLEQKKYLKCLWGPCLYVTDNIEDMENHYLNSCKKTFWSKLLFQCEFCHGRLTSDNDLQSHIRTAHESKTYLKSINHPGTNFDCVKVWSNEILISKQAKCFFPGCRFVDNNIKIMEKHYASCIGKKRITYSVCTSCGCWSQNDSRLREHIRCIHKDLDEESASRLRSEPEIQNNPIIYEMAPEKNHTVQKDVGVEMDNNKLNDMNKCYSVNKAFKKSSNDDLSSTLASKSAELSNCHEVNDRSGIQCNNEIIEIDDDSSDVPDNDSANGKNCISDRMKLISAHKKFMLINRRRCAGFKLKFPQKSLYPVPASTPLQVFANEMMKENKDSSTVPVMIKINDKDWTVNVSKTVVTQTKSSDEFPTDRDSLFQALKDESYKLLKLVSKKNSVRNDVRMVFDPDETRVTPFHINFKINDNNSETTGDDSFVADDVESSGEDLHSDKLIASERSGIITYYNKKTVEASDNNSQSVLDNSPSVSDTSNNTASISDTSHYEGHHNDVSVIKLPNCSDEEHFLLEPKSSLEGSQCTIQQLYSDFEQIQHEGQNNCEMSPEIENEIKEETAQNKQFANQLYSTNLDCGAPQENFVIKEELNELTIVPVSCSGRHQNAAVEVTSRETYQNNNNTVCQENVLADNTFESEYILPDIDYVDNQTSFKCTTQQIDITSLDEDSNEMDQDLSDNEALGNSVNEIPYYDITPEVNDIGYIEHVKLDKEFKLNNDSPSSSFHCLETNNKESNQTFGVEKDPLCMDGFNEGIIFQNSETDLFHLSNENVSDRVSDIPCKDVVTEEKNSCCRDSKNGESIMENESSDKQIDDFVSRWNWSTLKKYNSKVSKKNSSARVENIQHMREKSDDKQVEDKDENFLGFSDDQSSSNYSKFINTCNKLGYYDDMAILNQHYEVSQSGYPGSKGTNQFITNENEISNICFSENCNIMTNSPELSTALKKPGRPNKRPRSYSSPSMSNAISEKGLTQSRKLPAMDNQVCNELDDSSHSIIIPIDFNNVTIDCSKAPVKKKRGRPRKLSLDSLQNKTVDQIFTRRKSLSIQNIDASSNKNVLFSKGSISSDNSSNSITEHKIDTCGPLTRGPGRPKTFKSDIHNHSTPILISLATPEIEKQENYSTNHNCDASDNLSDKNNFNNIETNSDTIKKKEISSMSDSSEQVEKKKLEKVGIKSLETSYAEEIIQNVKNHDKNTLVYKGDISNHSTTDDDMDLVGNETDNSRFPDKRCPGQPKKIKPQLKKSNTLFGVQEIEKKNVQLVCKENSDISGTKCTSDVNVTGIFDHSAGNGDHTEILSVETDREGLVEISNSEEIITNKPGSYDNNMVPFEGDISSPIPTNKDMNLLNNSPKKVTPEPQTKESTLFIKEVGLCQSEIILNNSCNELSTIKTKSSREKIGISETSTPIQKNIPPVFNDGIILNDNISLVENENEPDRQNTSLSLLNRKRVCKRKASTLSDCYFLNKENDSDLDVDEANNKSVIKKVNEKNESGSLSEKKNRSELIIETAKEDIIDSYEKGAESLQKNCLPPLKRRPSRPKKCSLVCSQNLNQNKLLKTYSSITPVIEQGNSYRAENISKNPSHKEPAGKSFLSPLTFIKGMDSNMSVSEMFINDFKKIEGNIDYNVNENDCFQPKRKRYNAPEIILQPAKDDNKNKFENKIGLLDAKKTDELLRVNCLDNTNEYIGKRNDNLDEVKSRVIKTPVESKQLVVQRKPVRLDPKHLKVEHDNQSVCQNVSRSKELDKTAEVIQSETNNKHPVPTKQSLEPLCPDEVFVSQTVCQMSVLGSSKIDMNEKEVLFEFATDSEKMIATPVENLQPAANRKQGRPKKQSLELGSNEVDNNQSTRQTSLLEGQETDVRAVSNCDKIENEKDVISEETPCTRSEIIDTSVGNLQLAEKRKRGRPKKQSLEPLSSHKEGGNQSNLGSQETEEVAASNSNGMKYQEEHILGGAPCSRSDKIIATPVEHLEPAAKGKRGRPKKQSLEPLSNEVSNNQSTRQTSLLEGRETDVRAVSNCDKIDNEDEAISEETPRTRSKTIDTPVEHMQPATKKKRGRPKRQSLEPLWSNEDSNTRSTRQTSLLAGQETEEVVASNCDGMKYQEVLLGGASCSRSNETIDSPVEELKFEVKRKRGRPKRQSLEPMWSNEDSNTRSTRQTSLLAGQETEEVVASNCDGMKYQEVLLGGASCSRSNETIDSPVEELKFEVKRKRGRPKRQSLEPMWSNEDSNTRSTRQTSLLAGQETEEVVASNCDGMKYQEVLLGGASCSRSNEMIDSPVEELKFEVKRKRGRPKRQSLEPMWSNEDSNTRSTRQTSLLAGQETEEVVASNCDGMKYQEVLLGGASCSRSNETIDSPVEELKFEVKRKRGRPKRQSLEPMWYNEDCENHSSRQSSLLAHQETDAIVSSNRNNIRNEELSPYIKLEKMIDTPGEVQKKRGRPKKTRSSMEVDLNVSDSSSHFSENLTLVDSELAASVERRLRKEKRASALSCMSLIKSNELSTSNADEGNQNFNTTSTKDMNISGSAEFIPKKRGRQKGWRKTSEHWTRNRIVTKTNYITYNNEDGDVRNSEEIQEHSIDFNSTLDHTFESESDLYKSTRDEGDSSKEIAEGDSSKEIAEGDSSKEIAEGDSSKEIAEEDSTKEMTNEENQTSKQKARKMKKQLLSGRVDTLTLLSRPNDQVKCAVCAEKMRVEDYQKSHLKKHNFVAWLEGEEPLPVHDIDYMDTVLLRGKRSHPKFIFRCEVCGQLKKSSKGYLSHRQFCGKTEREKEKIMAVCDHCGKIMVPASLAPHIYKHHKADSETDSAVTPEKTGPTNVSRKAAERCLGKIASYIEDEDSSPLKNDNENEDFQHDVDGDEEYDEIEEITLLYTLVQKKKANKCLINRWKKFASKNREIKCPGPSCQFRTLSFNDILEHHKTCISAGFQGYSCIKCNFICISEEEIREHVKSCNPPIIVSQSDNSEDEVPERHVMIPYLRTEELSLVYQRYKCQFFKPALNWMNKIYQTHFSQEPLFDDLKLNIESWKEMDMKASQHFNPEKSQSMRISFQNSPWENMHTLEGKVIDGNEGIAFTGGPIWGLEWCPGEGDQYLAVSSHLTMESNFQAGCTFNGPGIVQLWSLEDITNAKNDPLNTLQFSYSICHNERACWNMAWCPSGGRTESRIGLLALATTSGSIPIYAMPDPKYLVPQLTRFYKPDPVLKLELWSTERWQCNSICWSKVKPHSIIVAGFVNGVVAVWDLSIQSNLLRKKNILHPFKVFQAHHSIVTGVCLSPDNNEYLATTSYDKSFKFWDLKDTTAPQSVLKRGLFTSVDWLRHWMAAVTTYDNAYTMLQTSVSLCPVRGFVTPTLQVVNNINSTSWSVTVNDWLNGAISSYDNGQVVLFLALKQTAYHHMEKRKYTKIILKSSLHSFENEDETQDKTGSKKKDEEAGQNNIPSNSYEEAVGKYGLAINTDLAVGKNDKFQSKNSGSLNDIYPMSSINRVAWNTNKQSFLYVAMGYQSGFLVVSKLAFPAVDQNAIDEISKKEN